jgi:hypothetical protein
MYFIQKQCKLSKILLFLKIFLMNKETITNLLILLVGIGCILYGISNLFPSMWLFVQKIFYFSPVYFAPPLFWNVVSYNDGFKSYIHFGKYRTPTEVIEVKWYTVDKLEYSEIDNELIIKGENTIPQYKSKGNFYVNDKKGCLFEIPYPVIVFIEKCERKYYIVRIRVICSSKSDCLQIVKDRMDFGCEVLNIDCNNLIL